MAGACTVTVDRVATQGAILMFICYVIPGMTTGALGFIGCLIRIINKGPSVSRVASGTGNWRTVITRIIRTGMGIPHTGPE